MARFTKSNRHAAEQMKATAQSARRMPARTTSLPQAAHQVLRNDFGEFCVWPITS